jgi:hypothetical protein
MNNLTTKCLLAAAALAVAGSVNAQQAQDSIVVESDSPMYLRTDGLPQYLAERLEQKAREGLRSLNQYVVRTRMIHQLSLDRILVTAEQANVAMASGEKVHLVLVEKDD